MTKRSELDQAALVEQQIESFPGRQLSFLVLLRNAIGATALLGERLAVMQVVESFRGSGMGDECSAGATAVTTPLAGFESARNCCWWISGC